MGSLRSKIERKGSAAALHRRYEYDACADVFFFIMLYVFAGFCGISELVI